jgi:diguanylate cyclase (GGDEF)-like protein
MNATANPFSSSQLEVRTLIFQAWDLRFTDTERCQELSRAALHRLQTQSQLEAEQELELGYTLRNLGFCAYVASDFEQALEQLSSGLHRARTHNDPVLERDCLNFTGAIYASLGDLESALDFVKACLELNTRMNDLPGLAFDSNNLGVIYNKLERFPLAKNVLEDALAQARSLKDPLRESTVLINLGQALSGLQEPAEAVKVLRTGLAVCETHRLHDRRIRTVVTLAEVLGVLGQFEEALELLNGIRADLEQDGFVEGLAQNHFTTGSIHLQRQQPQDALEPLHLALELADQANLLELACQVHDQLASAHGQLSQFKAAFEHTQAHHKLDRQLRDLESDRRLRAFALQRETEKAKAEAQLERIRNIELARALAALEQTSNEKSELVGQLEAKSLELERLTMLDPLTETYNRRHLETALASEFAKAKALERPLPVAMIDVDHFKQINDTCSHQVGDAVLIRLAATIRKAIRASDAVARFGGEEFVVILPRATFEEAQIICERIRSMIEDFAWTSIHPDLHVTVSIGLATDSSLPSFEKLLSNADEQLYRAKHAGRNRVCS